VSEGFIPWFAGGWTLSHSHLLDKGPPHSTRKALVRPLVLQRDPHAAPLMLRLRPRQLLCHFRLSDEHSFPPIVSQARSSSKGQSTSTRYLPCYHSPPLSSLSRSNLALPAPLGLCVSASSYPPGFSAHQVTRLGGRRSPGSEKKTGRARQLG